MSKNIKQKNTEIGKDQLESIGAIKNCIEFAKEHLGKSVLDVAAEIGLESAWVLYKWIESGKIPLSEIVKFEAACGCKFITKTLAESHQMALVKLTTNTNIEPLDIYESNLKVVNAISKTIAYGEGNAALSHTVIALNAAIEQLAFIRHQLLRGEK